MNFFDKHCFLLASIHVIFPAGEVCLSRRPTPSNIASRRRRLKITPSPIASHPATLPIKFPTSGNSRQMDARAACALFRLAKSSSCTFAAAAMIPAFLTRSKSRPAPRMRLQLLKTDGSYCRICCRSPTMMVNAVSTSFWWLSRACCLIVTAQTGAQHFVCRSKATTCSARPTPPLYP